MILFAVICWLFARFQQRNDEAQQSSPPKYSDSDFYMASFDWMKKNCETADQYINFANLCYYYGGTNLRVSDPYPFLAYLYNGVDWDGDKMHAEEAEDLFYSIAMELLQGAGIDNGYADEYELFEDERRRIWI